MEAEVAVEEETGRVSGGGVIVARCDLWCDKGLGFSLHTRHKTRHTKPPFCVRGVLVWLPSASQVLQTRRGQGEKDTSGAV